MFKALKLWSLYVDLEESLGTVESVKAVYDRVLDLRVATPQIIVNYAKYLEDRKYYEDSFKVFERGVEMFSFPIVFEIWNIYLNKFIARHGGNRLEHLRDLFEQALAKCPAEYAKPLYLMYGKLEDEHGLARHALRIYQRATDSVEKKDRYDMYIFYIAKTATCFGLAATREIYEKAIQVLPDAQTREMCLQFAGVEKQLGEIDRARAIYIHGSQFADPKSCPTYWQEWHNFEVQNGNEDTYKELLRLRRTVQAKYNI